MMIVALFAMFFLVIIALFYTAVHYHKKRKRITPLILAGYVIASLITLTWLFYAFILLAIIFKGV